MKKLLRILDKAFIHVSIIAMLAFMIYGCSVVPESPIAPFAALCVCVYLLWIAADIYFWFNDRRIYRDIHMKEKEGKTPSFLRFEETAAMYQD